MGSKFKAECNNCGAIWHEDDLNAVKNIYERVAPGEPMPSGECPNCEALCHRETPELLGKALEFYGCMRSGGDMMIRQDPDSDKPRLEVQMRLGGAWCHAQYAATLEDAYEFLSNPHTKRQYFAVCGRMPGDDEDHLIAVEAWPWEGPGDLFARHMYAEADEKLPLNWWDITREGKFGEWAIITGALEFTGPPA